MEGKVKITVIATGFDRGARRRRPAAQATTTTPVDMSAYTAAASRRPRSALVVNGGRVVVPRRPVLDLPALALARRLDGRRDRDADDDDASPLDVPAFLRRQEG